MFNNLLKLFKKEYLTLNKIEISKSALTSNYHYLSSLSPKLKITPVLKSNAYGHGIIEAAKILDPEKAPYFCVDSLYEAYQLLKAKVKTPILIMGYTNPQNFKVKKLPFTFAVYDLTMAKILNSYQWDAKVHIKVDTGMHRLGVPLKDLPQFLKEIKKLTNLKVEGLMSHFASAKNTRDPLFLKQVGNFKRARQMVKMAGFNLKWSHLTASEGLLNPEARKIITQFTNLARSGRALYGIPPSEKVTRLQPVLKLVTHIAQIKTIAKGERVGYDGTYIAKKETTLGLLPIGYFDGVDRRLSNKGFGMIDGVECPITGKVSMNITAVDITKVKNPELGQEVVVYSNHTEDKNSVFNNAKICQTIPYEILVHLVPSTRRVIV
ncbi:MAG: alanine racemase [bacterium]|nr:alanine racemase [bacterium]